MRVPGESEKGEGPGEEIACGWWMGGRGRMYSWRQKFEDAFVPPLCSLNLLYVKFPPSSVIQETGKSTGKGGYPGLEAVK